MFITLDPPYFLGGDATDFTFVGWAQVRDSARPRILMDINGAPVALTTTIRPPRLDETFPGIQALGFYARVDFAEALARAPRDRVREPFLLEVTVNSEGHARTFEYAVTEDWTRSVLGCRIAPRPMPPEHLQIRVAGAAAGDFYGSGSRVAAQMEALLARLGHPLSGPRDILDFGCGPGRMIGVMRGLRPDARLVGIDIDPEAIAWAQTNLGQSAEFLVNPHRPPMPIPSQSIDLAYALSVFTHLPSSLQHAWLADLHRVLRPGGILVTTKMNAAAYNLPASLKTEAETRGFAYWSDAGSTPGLPDYYRLTYHSDAYVRGEWGRRFEVLHVGSHDLNDTQDAVVLRKPGSLFGRIRAHIRARANRRAHTGSRRPPPKTTPRD